jgi:methionine biosynthesis protein MetW
MQQIKHAIRSSPLRPLYLWLAGHYRTLRRLFIYPETARVGAVDYDVYWEKKAQSGMGILSPWRLRRAQVFARVIPPGSSVLDVGVGDGALLKFLVEQRGVRAYGLDLSPKAVEFCHSIGLHEVRLGDANRPIHQVVAETFGADARFDYAICSEIIEHLPDPETLLLDLRRVVQAGIIVSIPNTGYHQHRLRLLLGRFPLQWVVTPGEHLRYWTRTDFRWWAARLGFRIDEEVPYEGTPGLKTLWPGLFAAAMVYVLTNASSSEGKAEHGSAA